jgi:hypothetical protein
MVVPRWRVIAPAMAAAFVLFVVLGQWQVNHPERVPWLFPVTNVLIVSLPSLAIALVVAERYFSFNPFAWPVSWREWSSGMIYGAVGATSVAGILNTLYLVVSALLVIKFTGTLDGEFTSRALEHLPRGWAISWELSVISVFAPLDEEFWKGMLVAFFFFRKGGAARCFLWGVLAGAGFNILETFQNSLSAIQPENIVRSQFTDSWWLFAVARAGTAAIHSGATGFSALGIYGLLRRQRRFLVGYPIGVSIHGTWNFLNFTLAGDAMFTGAGPDSRLLDLLSVAGMVVLAATCLVLLWEVPRRLKDAHPAAIYRVLGMLPREPSGDDVETGQDRSPESFVLT